MKGNQSKSDRSIRHYEATIVVALTLPLWIFVWGTMVSRFGFLTEMLGYGQGTWLLGVIVLVGVLGLLIGWLAVRTLDTTIAVVLLGIAICFGVTEAQSRIKAEATDFHTRQTLYPRGFDLRRERKFEPGGTLTMELLDSFDVTDFSIAGVSLGKLPCEISIAKLRRLLPDFAESVERKLAQAGGNQVPLKVSLELNGFEHVDAKVLLSGGKDKKLHLDFWISSEKWDAQIKDLIDRARLDGYETSPEWCEAFLTFGRHGWIALKQLVNEDPKVSDLLDDLAQHRYGIHDNMTSEQAWDVLMRISEEAKENGNYFSGSWPHDKHAMPEIAFSSAGRAVKLLASQLDHQQVCDALITAIKRGQWENPRQHGGEVYPVLSPIRKPKETSFPEVWPLIHAGWEIDRALNQEDPENYNIIERQVGNALFAQTAPRPTQYYYSDLLKLLANSDEEKPSLFSVFGLSRESGYISTTEFTMPLYGSPLADQYLLRQWQCSGAKLVSGALGDEHLVSKLALQTGLSLRAHEGAEFGSTKINHWHRRLLGLDSPTGREFRRNHRKELLELAIRSIGPIEKKKKPKIKKGGASQAMGALASMFNFSPSNRPGEWPILQHLEWIMIDGPGIEENPSLAMEFWPYLDAMIDTFPKLRDRERLRLRWNYLSRIWPESDMESFVSAYLKTPSLERQEIFNDIHLRGPGLPDTLSVEARLKILQRLQEELENLPGEEKQNYVFIYSQNGLMITEEQTILRAIGTLDCPEGATTRIKIHKKSYGRGFKNLGPLPPTREETESLLRSVYEWRYPDRFARDDRIDLLANHEDVNLRRIAVAMIRYSPKTRCVKLLPALIKDDAPIVKAEAIAVEKELDRILEAELPSRSLQKPAPHRGSGEVE